MPHYTYQNVSDAFEHMLGLFAKEILESFPLHLRNNDGDVLQVPNTALSETLYSSNSRRAEQQEGVIWYKDTTGKEYKFGSLLFAWKIWQNKHEGIMATEVSRNGTVIYFVDPVTCTYLYPYERVLTNEVRDCNPFFHLAESFWMLAGRDDVASLAFFVPRMREYSDNHVTFHGAYGHRWRHSFGFDQLAQVINTLHSQPHGRRAYLDHWQPERDTVLSGSAYAKDLPCNLGAAFRVDHTHRLNMTVFNRSNDMMWGAFGANYVHFGMLQQYIANQLDVSVGEYHQISNNIHLYLSSIKSSVEELVTAKSPNRIPLNNDVKREYKKFGTEPFFIQRTEWCFSALNNARTTTITETMPGRLFPEGAQTEGDVCSVLVPVIQAYGHYRKKEFKEAAQAASKIAWTEWRYECLAWLERRNNASKAE